MTAKNQNRPDGFTLIEVIIAISIFVFLALLLTGFVQRGLDLWKTGENRGDIYERGQIVMEQLKKDLSGVFNGTDRRYETAYNFTPDLYLNVQDFMEPSFYAGPDQNGNPWIYFIRLNNDTLYTPVVRSSPTLPTYKINRERIVYRLSPPGAEPQLIRETISENTSISFWQQGLERQNQVPAAQTRQAFDDVLYLESVFSGTASTWDSRITPQIIPPSGTYLEAPQNLPLTARITVDIKAMSLNTPKIKLTKSLAGNIAAINLPRSFLEPGSSIKIGNEWLLVQGKSYYQLSVLRGQRNTDSEIHGAGAEVQYGESITNTFSLPAAFR